MRRPTIINQPTSPRRPSARSRDMKATRPQQKPQRTKQKVVRETHKTNNSFLTRQWLYEESNDTLPGCDGRRSSINRRHRDALPRVRYIWTTEPTVLDTQVRMETVKNGARHETFNTTGEPSRKTTKIVARWVLPWTLKHEVTAQQGHHAALRSPRRLVQRRREQALSGALENANRRQIDAVWRLPAGAPQRERRPTPSHSRDQRSRVHPGAGRSMHHPSAPPPVMAALPKTRKRRQQGITGRISSNDSYLVTSIILRFTTTI